MRILGIGAFIPISSAGGESRLRVLVLEVQSPSSPTGKLECRALCV
jgi:hypothetical protein